MHSKLGIKELRNARTMGLGEKFDDALYAKLYLSILFHRTWKWIEENFAPLGRRPEISEVVRRFRHEQQRLNAETGRTRPLLTLAAIAPLVRAIRQGAKQWVS